MGDETNAPDARDNTNNDVVSKSPFDSTLYRISCSMMQEIETIVYSKFDRPERGGKHLFDQKCPVQPPSFDLGISQLTPVDKSNVKKTPVDDVDDDVGGATVGDVGTIDKSNVEKTPVDDANKDEWNFAFQNERGVATVPIVSFESLYPGICVHVSVLKCWASILNHKDQYINKNDLTRFFCPCTMLAKEEFKDGVKEADQITNFTSKMESALNEAGLDCLLGIDLLFIPILHAGHYYVMCFNLKKAHVEVLDNIDSDVDFDTKYALRPQIMQSTLCSYLMMTSHPIESKLRICIPKRLAIPWRTKNNFVDCGVFVMRHMETYKGTSIRKWECGLNKETDEQQAQLVDIRLKYLAKIILSDNNIHKNDMVAEVREYMQMTTEVRDKISDDRFTRIKEMVDNAL